MSFGASKDLETLANMVFEAAIKSPQHTRYAQICLERLLVIIKPELKDQFTDEQNQSHQAASWEFGTTRYQVPPRNYSDVHNSHA